MSSGWPPPGGLFDPQTHRDAQNDECGSFGPDVITPEASDDEIDPRRVCEQGVGVIDTVLYSADDFINDHLLSMLGAPDASAICGRCWPTSPT